ncbi:hypothetical protein GC194_10235 [bacterium]|nr:hypothetical protein [bacterium]
MWYKLTEKTIWGLYMSLAGSVVTIVMLFGLVPVIGYMGAAWATLASFFTMMMMSFVVGRKFYYVAYNYRRITVYICLAIVFWLIYQGAGIEGVAQQVVIANTLVLFFVAFVWAIEKPRKLLLLRK